MPLVGQRWMKNRNLIYKVWDRLGPILFPLRCPVCDKILTPEEVERGIHSICREKLLFVQGPVCMHCGKSLKNMEHTAQTKTAYFIEAHAEEFCTECQRKGYVRTSFYAKSANYPQNNKVHRPCISQGKAIYFYRGEMKKTMYRFKYGNRRSYARYFAQEAIRVYGDWIRQQRIDVIVPVPMFWKKQRRRGYNQAESFGKELSRLLEIPLETKLVQRVKDTIPQKELGETERKNNLENAFQIKKNIVQYKYILLVDDIYTTGSTVEAVARELFQKGVREIFVLSICIGEDI